MSNASVQPVRARYCESFGCRLRGLTFRRALEHGEGLLLVYAKDSRLDTGIHMLGVLMDLAIAWINSDGTVVDGRMAHSWRSLIIPQQPARYVLEMHPRRLRDFLIGDKVRFEEVRGMD